MTLASKCLRRCEMCGRPIETQRVDWAVALCFACLPPPKPLSTVPVDWFGDERDSREET